jgi:hypothetical protein
MRKCYNYIDQWGNLHSEVKIPYDKVITEISFGGGYGYHSWASTYYLLSSGEIINSGFSDLQDSCYVYKNEDEIVKTIVRGFLSHKNHPKVNVYNIELFKEKFPLLYKLAKYYYCKRDLSYLSVVIYDKRYRSICFD